MTCSGGVVNIHLVQGISAVPRLQATNGSGADILSLTPLAKESSLSPGPSSPDATSKSPWKAERLFLHCPQAFTCANNRGKFLLPKSYMRDAFGLTTETVIPKEAKRTYYRRCGAASAEQKETARGPDVDRPFRSTSHEMPHAGAAGKTTATIEDATRREKSIPTVNGEWSKLEHTHFN